MQKIRDIKQIFGTQSVKPDALVAPFRQMALDLYMHMNDAIAKFVFFSFYRFFLIFSSSTSLFQTKREGYYKAHHVLVPKTRFGDAKNS